ncbi:hypothetical protein SAMN04487965_0194 [Microbulbifer donghaiensis]|uniref:Uncharacterized protein n=1 Tax=Microbulbifer donghaiensis TaxID=494016 RepID=A0A1M4UKV7_9GAMM|nr:hypothetical protein [Microbulbifer donghaiensis]SHE57411.1 hypothetical protein SAMN04487965_0194 [Microbulbifer donghaiensis]
MRTPLLMFALLPLAAIAGVIAEGKSSLTPHESIEAGWRMFTIDTSAEACASAGKPVRFEIEPKVVTLHPGESWHPDKLVVRAYDANNRFVASVPLVISISGSSDVVDVRGSESIVRALRPGQQTITISNYCDHGLKHVAELRVLDERVQ